MRRRDILALFAGALASRPLPATAQPGDRVRVIGVLIGLTEKDPENPLRIANFERGLRDLGWIDGRNLRIHYRFGADADRLQASARELLALQPAIIVASSSFVVFELLRLTQTIPFTSNYESMGGKWLELLMEIAPNTDRVAVMFNPATATGSRAYFFPAFESAARSIAVTPVGMPVHNAAEIEPVLAAFGRAPGGGLIVTPDNFAAVHRGRIVAEAARQRVPAIYSLRYFATEGGLMSYGVDLLDLYRRAAANVDRILKGASPADIPVQVSAKVDLVINLKTANELGLAVPRIMLARANEVIE